MFECDFIEEVVISPRNNAGLAIAKLPAGYSGPCAVHVDDKRDAVAVFPSAGEACSAAKFAVSELGGYARAIVTAQSSRPVTHKAWTDWAFSC